MNFNNFIKKLNSNRTPLLAVLIDPDKFNKELIIIANKTKVSCFLVGGSKLHNSDITKTVKTIKKLSKIPVILFPGDKTQLCKHADGLLLLSLVSGNNPDYLIGKHIKAAPVIKKTALPHLPTAYILIDGGKISTTQQVTKTEPINSKNETLIINTCIASQQLGFKAIYLEAGSGANYSISAKLIKKIKKQISIPIIVGGGISTSKKTKQLINSGANMLVIGNILEKDVYLLPKINMCF